jgi:hypothetical protein
MSPTRRNTQDEEPLADAEAPEPADDALPGHRWAESSYAVFGLPPEVVKNAINPDELYTRDQIEVAIQAFMTRQAG